MIEQAIARWHRYMEGDRDELERLLADDVVFYSPIVFTPQRGKTITLAYLTAAATALSGDGGFRYTKEVLAGDTAVLEFETTVDGKYVNGVDIIRVEGEQIVEFRVMVRPLQAVNAVHQQMMATLAAAQAPTAWRPRPPGPAACLRLSPDQVSVQVRPRTDEIVMSSTVLPPAPFAPADPRVRLRQRLAVQRTLSVVLVERAAETKDRSRLLVERTCALVQDLAVTVRRP